VQVVVNGTWCFTVAPDDSRDVCEIAGANGSISFPVFGSKVTVRRNGQAEEFIFDPLPHVQQPMIEKVTNYFLGRGDNPCSAADAIASMQVMDWFTAK